MNDWATVEADIVDSLASVRRDAGVPEMGMREIEFQHGRNSRVVWAVLRDLRARGLVVRSGGWCWLTETAYAERVMRKEGAA